MVIASSTDQPCLVLVASSSVGADDDEEPEYQDESEEEEDDDLVRPSATCKLAGLLWCLLYGGASLMPEEVTGDVVRPWWLNSCLSFVGA